MAEKTSTMQTSETSATSSTGTFLKKINDTVTSTTNTIRKNKAYKSFNNFFQKKNVKAVLYILLILYASLIAPKLPNWIIPYFEYSFVKILIVFIIGLLATKDPIAAIIATIGVTVTYLFISENKITNYINNIFDKENDDNEDKKKEHFYQQQANQQQVIQPVMNIEHFNNKNEKTTHIIEHFDMRDTKQNETNTENDNKNITAYDNQNYANNVNINY